MAQSKEEFAFLKRVYQDLNPLKRLPPDDPFYHPVYATLTDFDPVEEIKTRIRFSDVESRHFFSGFRGSGKTTELLRLQRDLEEEGYLVFYADALQFLNPNLPIEISDLLIVLAGAFSDAVEAYDASLKLTEESYWTRLRHYLTTTEIEWKEFLLSVKDAGSVKASLRETPSFRQKVQGVLSTRLAELEQQTKKFLEESVAALRRDRPEVQIVFLFDQLEQLRGSRLTDQDVLSSVERLFTQHRERLNLPSIHAVYTVPPWLKFILPGTPITILPSVRQWENDAERTRYPKGDECLWQVLEKRFGGRDELLRFFGTEEGVWKLIQVCGGHFRDLFELARTAVARAKQLPVTDGVLESAIAEVRSNYLPIPSADAVGLQGVAESRSHGLRTARAEDVNRFTHFLDTHLVLFLRNGEEWYDVHPIIREDVREEARRAAVAAAPRTDG